MNLFLLSPQVSYRCIASHSSQILPSGTYGSEVRVSRNLSPGPLLSPETLLVLMALPLLWLGLLPHVRMEVMKIPVEEGMCTTVPCRLEFPKESPNNSLIMGYWLNKNISYPVITNQSNAAIDDSTNGKFNIIWNLEEQDCTLLTHHVLQRDNMTYLSSAVLGEQRGALLKENITLFLSDLTQKPELYIPEIPMLGKPVTLTCTIKGSCTETKALFLSWKESTMSFNTDGFRNSSSSSSVLYFAPKPADHGTTLQCQLNFSLPNLTRSVQFPVALPVTLFRYSCSLKMVMQCSCLFYGVPTPTVQWFMEGVPVRGRNMSNILQVMTTLSAPWANSTINIIRNPERVTSLYCEGKNKYGVHASKGFLVADKNLVSKVFVKGLIQGIMYGIIIATLFFFFLVLLVMKMLNWWVKHRILKDEEALVLKKPTLLEEPETSKETEAEPSPAQATGDVERGTGLFSSEEQHDVAPLLQEAAEEKDSRTDDDERLACRSADPQPSQTSADPQSEKGESISG